jgi:hypothetical protein
MKKYFIVFQFLLMGYYTHAQSLSISGFVIDNETKEGLIGVNIYDTVLKRGTTTNGFGYYNITFNKGDSLHLLFSYIGYRHKAINRTIDKDMYQDIYLSLNNTLNLVEVTATRRIEKTTDISVVSIPMEQLKTMPSLMGEADIMRSFQLMPGIQGGKEGTSGIYVRGGSPDQNLFLLDDIPLYSVSHIGGLMSTFDPNAINDIKLYKGGFPARYGGRLSSVVDIRMKDGNKQKLSGEFAIGTLSTKFFIEGPITKDSSSFFLSFRRCNIDLATRLISLFYSDGKAMTGYTFYDIYGKYNKKFKHNDRLCFSFYSGRDNIFTNINDKSNNIEIPSYKVRSKIKWGNIMAALRYNHIFNAHLFSNFTLAYTKYFYRTKAVANKKEYDEDEYHQLSELVFSSGVDDIIAKGDFDYYAFAKHQIRFGFSGIIHSFNPGQSFYSETLDINNTKPKQGAAELGAYEVNAYIEDEFVFSKELTAHLGLRFSQYFVNSQPYYSIQPRINLNYLFHDSYSIKASYVSMNQYVHLLSSSGVGMPTDLWIPTTTLLKPEKSSQFTLGIVHTLEMAYPIEVSAEAYYKTLKNIIEYKEGASFLINSEDWEERVERNGTAEMYGVEFLVQKKEGKTTGWITYTLSYNNRSFHGIQNGKPFPYKYDRRHDISVVVNHKFTKNIVFSATWTFHSGDAITLANNHYSILNQDITHTNNGYMFSEVHLYNGRNSYRMPTFHKLDIGVSFIKKKKRGVRTLNISIYNLYSRFNPFYLYYKYDMIDHKTKLYQYSLFPFIPSISYSFKF